MPNIEYFHVMDDALQHSLDLLAPHQQLLHKRLQCLLSTLQPTLHADVIRVLEEPGKLLSTAALTKIDDPSSSSYAGIWSLLPLLIAQYINPEIDSEYVSSVAVAVELAICAFDLLDDIEDGDQTPLIDDLGSARVLNVSTALFALAHHCVLSVSQYGVSAECIVDLLNIFQACTLDATGGQHRDLLSEQQAACTFTREECIEIAEGKAGSLMRMACYVGALCAGADKQMCMLFAEFGKFFGIYQQLDNDCHDLYHLIQGDPSITLSTGVETPDPGKKTDLVRNKKTLPIVLAAHRQNKLLQPLDKKKGEYLRTLQEGIVVAWGICLLYRERARECLQKIDDQRPISPALHLLLNLV